MHQPNPWLLFIGGVALLNVSAMVWGLHAALWARYVGMGVCIGLGLLSMVLGVVRHRERVRRARAPVRAASRGGRAASTGPARPAPGAGGAEKGA